MRAEHKQLPAGEAERQAKLIKARKVEIPPPNAKDGDKYGHLFHIYHDLLKKLLVDIWELMTKKKFDDYYQRMKKKFGKPKNKAIKLYHMCKTAQQGRIPIEK